MKKILLTAFAAVFLFSCSNDTDTFIEQSTSAGTIAVTADALMAKGLKGTSVVNQKGTTTLDLPGVCVKTCTAFYDNTGAFDNPEWTFIANVPQELAPSTSVKIYLEIQQTDCEDITNGIGNIISVTDNIVFNNIYTTPPSVNRKPSALLQCYRWRMRLIPLNIKGAAVINSFTYVSPWYDAPMG